MGHNNCSNQNTRFFSRMELGRLIVWTEDYRRPTVRASKHFFIVNRVSQYESLIKVLKFFYCNDCRMFAFEAKELKVEPLVSGTNYLSHIYISSGQVLLYVWSRSCLTFFMHAKSR